MDEWSFDATPSGGYIDFEETRTTEIISFIRKKKVAYPTEISQALGIEIRSVMDILWKLVKDGKLEPYSVGEEPDELMHPRLMELWARGIKGKEAFQRMRWFTIPKQVTP